MNGIIIVDKPEGWTSQDVCSKLRGLFREKRVGHGGTLDPMATGVLPVFLGRATRAAQFSENSEKSYVAGMRLGITTDTQDTTGRIMSERPVSVTKDDILSLLPSFTGELDQIPPMYSAVKIGGKKLYELARKGQELERTPRRINIKSLELSQFSGSDCVIFLTCSKGTYVRTLINDIGAALGCGAAMSSLRRTSAGGFSIESAVPLETLINADGDNRRLFVRPTDSIFSSFPAVYIEGRALLRALNGNEFSVDAPDGQFRVYSDSGDFILFGECRNGTMKTIKSFFEV
ncbi:MAG: tRNA pseudouridine(55) synthase TruB [Oscillospiraceae bacterium]|nr:tRNA pseudouridine(55) synthase TruB [Oscillospiraceae bacterium]